MNSQIFLSLGSNIGHRRNHLREALERLEKRGIVIHSVSSLYETEPVGTEPQREFINLACEVTAEYSSTGLLNNCLAVEKQMGRLCKHDKSPRTIDIDILFYASEIISTPRLTIPHPALHQRRFVLVPMAEIAASFVDPLTGKKIAELLQDCRDSSAVRKIGSRPAGRSSLIHAPESSGCPKESDLDL